MLLELLATANSPRVLVALQSLGGTARYTDVRNTARLGDAQVTRALKDLNKRGLVAAKPQADRSMHYAVTKAGTEIIALMNELHGVVHGRHGAVAKSADKEFESILVI